MCNEAIEKAPWSLKYVPVCCMTHEMCNEAMCVNPVLSCLVPDHLKTQEVYNKAVHIEPRSSKFVPDHFKTQEMCNEAVLIEPRSLAFVLDHFKTQEMCDKAVRDDPSSLRYDWFVTREGACMWYDDDYAYNDNEMIKWYEGYNRCRAQKAEIKDDLMPIAWHPSRWYDWCVSEDEKKRQKNCGSNR